MQAHQNINNLFDLKVAQCSHILNIFHKADPALKDIPLHKGNLFLGGVGSFKQLILNTYKITSVLSIIDKLKLEKYMIKEKIQEFKILNHKWVDVEDQQNSKISEYFQQTYKFIKQQLQNHNVLIHCQVGVSRSASITIAFLMRQYKLTFSQAIQIVRKNRLAVKPNQGFKAQLIQLEDKIFKE